MNKPMCAVGMMSGTSLDGIDIALVQTNGESNLQRIAFASYPYDPSLTARLRDALEVAKASASLNPLPQSLRQLERDLTVRHAESLKQFLWDHEFARGYVDVVGFHGQTVLHAPERGVTLQIGDGQALANMIGRPVVSDMRANDVRLGGQGAPLVPIYHKALFGSGNEVGPAVAVLNIGGVANVTFVGADGELIAFDTGPGNALLDDWLAGHTEAGFDRDGAISATGEVDADRLNQLLGSDYFVRPPPKSLDRNAFDVGLLQGVELGDGAATLAAFTAGSVALAQQWFPCAPARWYVCGGGRHNPTIMDALRGRLSGDVVGVEAAGFNGDAIEAEAWAYLAVRSRYGLPLTFPSTTGVPSPATGGRQWQPQSIE